VQKYLIAWRTFAVTLLLVFATSLAMTNGSAESWRMTETRRVRARAWRSVLSAVRAPDSATRRAWSWLAGASPREQQGQQQRYRVEPVGRVATWPPGPHDRGGRTH